MPSAFETFETRGAAGETLRADLDLPHETPLRGLIALAHGFKGFARWGFLPDLGRRLADAGFATLRPDFSHNGTGEDRGLTYERLDLFEKDCVAYRKEDLAHAIQEARTLHPEFADVPLILAGHSLGGGLAQLVCEEFNAAALVTLAAVPTFQFPAREAERLAVEGRILVPNQRTGDMMPLGAAALADVIANREAYDLMALAERRTVPWLIVHGSEDHTVDPKASRSLAAASAGRAELLSIDGASHTFNCQHPMEEPDAAYSALVDAVLRFLERAVQAPPHETGAAEL